MAQGNRVSRGQRVIIIGNSGSGKTFLANKISPFAGEVFHLDEFFWQPGGFNKKRPQDAIAQELLAVSKLERWVVEGVYGELVEFFVEKAACLIWLDMDWEVCRKNLLHRGSESSKQLDSETARINFLALIDWASKYWERTNPRSYLGHQQLYDRFPRSKYRLKSKGDLNTFVIAVSASYNSSEF
ncbi:MAG: hypothetical protein WEA61_06155 [Anaerolineales bacterium]